MSLKTSKKFQIFKDICIKLFNFKINLRWIKHEKEKAFSKFFAKIINSNLALYNEITENNYDVLLACYGIHIRLIDEYSLYLVRNY